MPGYDQSLADLIRSTLHDAQDLMRGEIALAKAELRQEVRKVGSGAAALAAAGVAALAAVMFLLTALALGLTNALGWPAWAGFLVVGVLLSLVGFVSLSLGRRRLRTFQAFPAETVTTLKENSEWIAKRLSSVRK